MQQRACPFQSQIDRSDEAFQINMRENGKLCEQLRERLTAVGIEGRERDRARHKRRGQLLARERVQHVLDEDSPFLELCYFAGFGNKATPRTGICGIGLVSGVEVMVMADVPTVRGGAKNEASVLAGLRCLHISMENRLPLINLIQTGGADLTQQHKVFHQGGETFRLLAVRAKMGLPTISIVFGSSTAGGAYHPGMSDYVIMVKKHAKVYLGGPPLVKMATGESVSHEELGGAQMHSTVSGVSDFLADDEPNAIRIAREIITTLPQAQHPGRKNLPRSAATGSFEEPLYPSSDLLGIVSASVKHPFDMAEVIARVVDGSRVTFFKSNFGKTLVCCWASIFGFPVAIIANNGVLFPDSSQKGAQFISLCNQKNTPIIFMHNISGFMVGRSSEHQGLIKYGALMVNAVSNSKVPHISLIVGASFGAGNYAMCGRAYKPRFLFAFPNAKCSVMGSEQLSGVMDIVLRERLAKMNASSSSSSSGGGGGEAAGLSKELEEMAQEQKRKSQELAERQMDAYFTSSMLLDDGIIDPRDTRFVLGLALSVIYNAEVEGGNLAGVSRL